MRMNIRFKLLLSGVCRHKSRSNSKAVG